MRAAKAIAAAAIAALLWNYGGLLDAQLFAVNAEARSATGLEQLQSEVAAALKARHETLNIDYAGDDKELSDGIKDVIRQAIGEDEYTAYIVDSYFYSIRSWKGDSRVKLSLNYRETLQETAEVDRQVQEVLGRILTPGMHDHQKVKAIHDWIVLRLAYDSGLERYTAYEALSTGQAVCQGYSLLTYRMLEEAGVPARIVEGKVESGDHAWNLVQLDGEWYHMDVTWDDPLPDAKGKVRYDYYLLSDEQMGRDHTWTKSYPEAKSVYRDAAARLAEDPKTADFYKGLERDLGWIWLKPEHTAESALELEEQIASALERDEAKLTVRYVRGGTVKEDLAVAMNDGFEGKLKGYQASYVPYGEGEDVLLTVKLDYA